MYSPAAEMILKEALESCSVQARGNVGPERYFFFFFFILAGGPVHQWVHNNHN